MDNLWIWLVVGPPLWKLKNSMDCSAKLRMDRHENEPILYDVVGPLAAHVAHHSPADLLISCLYDSGRMRPGGILENQGPPRQCITALEPFPEAFIAGGFKMDTTVLTWLVHLFF